MSHRPLLALLSVVVSVLPSLAMDSLNMPTGNFMKPGESELNFIYVNQPLRRNPAGQIKIDDMRYAKLFTGITDRLQLDVDYLDIAHAGDYIELNAYYALVKETPEHPSLIVGATNLTSSDWLGGSDFGGDPDNDEPAPLVMGAYTLARSAKPTWEKPMVRLHLGWGDKFHGDDLFGMLQFKFHPRLMAVVQNYRGVPTYIGTVQATDDIQLSAGTMDGNTFWRVGGVMKW